MRAVDAAAGTDAEDRSVTLAAALVATLAVPVLPILHIGNRFSTRRTLAVVARLGRIPFPKLACEPRQIGRGVNGAARVLRLQGTTCLARSQLVWLLLSLCGRRPVIRLGSEVGLGSGTFAHAWVELDGIPIGDSANVVERHPPFDRPLLGPVT